MTGSLRLTDGPKYPLKDRLNDRLNARPTSALNRGGRP